MEKMLRGGRIRQDTVIYMDYGARELGSHPGMAARFGQVAGLLLERKVDLTARIVPGGSHNEASWEKQIPFFVPPLLYGLEERVRGGRGESISRIDFSALLY